MDNAHVHSRSGSNPCPRAGIAGYLFWLTILYLGNTVMRSFEELLIDAGTMHRGCICPGQVLGVRMAMLGCQLLGIDEPTQDKRLIVYVEIDRCMADAIAAVTGCHLGKRTLKHVDYGKCACTFVDMLTGRAFRSWPVTMRGSTCGAMYQLA